MVLTDLEVYLGQLRDNIAANSGVLGDRVQAVALDWSQEVPGHLRGGVDLLLVSDCVYYEQSLGPLVSTMATLTHAQSKVLLAMEKRPEKEHVYGQFFPLLEQTFTKKELSQSVSQHGNLVVLYELKKNVS